MSLRAFLRRIRGQTDEMRADLRRLGLDLLKDDKLTARLDVMYQVMEKIRQTEEVEQRVELVDNLIRIAALAWGRAGDRALFAKMMMHWEKLMRIWRDFARMKHDETIPKERREDIARLVDSFGEREIIPYGLMIIDVSFMDKDVAPSYVAVIQQTGMPFGGMPVIPSAGLPKAEQPPPEEPIPKKVKSEI